MKDRILQEMGDQNWEYAIFKGTFVSEDQSDTKSYQYWMPMSDGETELFLFMPPNVCLSPS